MVVKHRKVPFFVILLIAIFLGEGLGMVIEAPLYKYIMVIGIGLAYLFYLGVNKKSIYDSIFIVSVASVFIFLTTLMN